MDMDDVVKIISYILRILAAIAILVGIYYIGYEGIFEPNQPGQRFGTEDKLELAAGTVLLFFGCLGIVVGFIYDEVS